MADDRENSNKLALLAHDLRTPLGAMRTAAELIGQGKLDDRQTACLDVLIRSIEALADMTGGLVAAAMPEARAQGKMIEATGLVRDTAELFRHSATLKGLRFHVSVSGDEALIGAKMAGPVRRALSALLDNAIKYTSSGSVSVEADTAKSEDHEGSNVRISIADTGPGIMPEDQPRLFKAFERGEIGQAAGDGAGLGLWGALQHIQEVGGNLRLVSPKAGGCRFEIDVPVSTGKKTSIEVKEIGTREPTGPLTCHVLVVDDNETNRRLMGALLDSFGATYEEADSGATAIKKIEHSEFDMVLLDLHMPHESGVDVARRLRASKAGGLLPIIAVTAALEATAEPSVREAGFLEVLTKPISPSNLYRALEHAAEVRADVADF